MCGLSVQIVARDGYCLFRSLSLLLEDDEQKVVLYLRARSFNHQLHLLVKVRVKEV
jgi:hypothetical protein